MPLSLSPDIELKPRDIPIIGSMKEREPTKLLQKLVKSLSRLSPIVIDTVR